MADEFFAQRGTTVGIDEDTFLASVGLSGGSLSDCFYDGSTIRSKFSPRKYRIKDAQFTNFSFSKTVVEEFDFINCTFSDCRFIGTVFKKCRFTNCNFLRCNTYRMELEDVFVDPSSFYNCIPSGGYENIGLALFQELLQNSRNQSQPDFTDEAHFLFRKWQRKQLVAEIKKDPLSTGVMSRALSVLVLMFLELSVGSGVKLGVFARTFCVVIAVMTTVN